MTGFDKWTSTMCPEMIAEMITALPFSFCALVCPCAYDGCKIERGKAPSNDKLKVHKSVCRKTVMDYFDKEME